MRILYYDCFAGISGDMHLGAMIGLGMDPGLLRSGLKRLNLEGYSLEIKKDQRRGIEGTRVRVHLEDQKKGSGHQPHRHLSDIEKIIKDSGLSQGLVDRSMKMFRLIAEAEARIHGMSVEEVHFHEVGAIDSIVDIVGAAICIEHFKPDRIIASPVELGSGMVKCAHGTFPVPAPATAEILKGVPVKTGGVKYEATTPTGAAILKANADEFSDKQDFTISKTAYGLGHYDTEVPNVLRLLLADTTDLTTEKAFVVECNIDDMNPEVYGFVMDELFDAGADDVYFTSIIMKKARPAIKLSALVRQKDLNKVQQVLLTQTTTLGLRTYTVDKIMMKRAYRKIETPLGEVRVKTAYLDGKLLKQKPEYEDCIRIARDKKMNISAVYKEIERYINSDQDRGN